jgi:hypothetical protein
MARIKFGSMVAGIDGSIAGHTLQRNAYGYTIRSKPFPKRNQSANQLQTHVYMRSVLDAWAAMTSANRRVWDQSVYFFNAKAKRNSDVLLYGKDLFTKWNMTRLMAGTTLETELQYVVPEWYDYAIDIKTYGGIMGLFFDPDLVNIDQWCLFKVSPPLSATAPIVREKARVCWLEYVGEYIFSFEVPYVESFGVIPEVGQYVDIWFKIFSTVSPFIFGEEYRRVEVVAF